MKLAMIGLSALIGLAAIAPAHAAVMASGANVFAGATAVIITGNKFNSKEKDAQAELKPGHKTVNSSASVVNQDAKGDRAFDYEDVFANFVSPTEGTVDLSGNSTSLATTANRIVEAFNSGSSFNYDFTLTSAYTFNVNYFLSETDNFYFDNYFQLIRTSGGGPIISRNPVDGSYTDPTIGSDSAFLTPGSYEFGVTSKLGDISGALGPGYSAGSHIDQYDFALTSAAPEPSAWIMMFAGLGGIGLMLRQAKRKMGFRTKDAYTA